MQNTLSNKTEENKNRNQIIIDIESDFSSSNNTNSPNLLDILTPIDNQLYNYRGIKFGWFELSVDDARNILKYYNHKNRKTNKKIINKYISEFDKNNWNYLNGDSIRISKSNQLLDGQHRLISFVVSNYQDADARYLTFIFFDIDTESHTTIDVGNSRSVSDILKIAGLHNTIKLPEGITEKQMESYLRALMQIKNKRVESSVNFHKTESIDMYNKHGGVANSFFFIRNLGVSNPIIPERLLIGFHYWCSKLDKNLADDFFTKFVKGTNLTEDDLIFQLRDRISSMDTQKAKLKIKMLKLQQNGSEKGARRINSDSRNDSCKLIATCWNRCRNGDTKGTLKTPKGWPDLE